MDIVSNSRFIFTFALGTNQKDTKNTVAKRKAPIDPKTINLFLPLSLEKNLKNPPSFFAVAPTSSGFFSSILTGGEVTFSPISGFFCKISSPSTKPKSPSGGAAAFAETPTLIFIRLPFFLANLSIISLLIGLSNTADFSGRSKEISDSWVALTDSNI